MMVPTPSNSTSLDLSVGDKIEVFWLLTRNEGEPDEEELPTWWPGVITGPLLGDPSQPIRADGKTVWCIRYEALDEFDSEEGQIVFDSKHGLRHVSDEPDPMAWRKQGDSWDAVDEIQADHTLSANEFLEQDMDEIREATGLQSEEEVMRHLQNSVPRERLLDGARAMQVFIDKFKEHITSLKDASGGVPGDFVITRDMISDFQQNLRSAGA